MSRHSGFLRLLLDGYNRQSVFALMLLLAVGLAVGFGWADLLRPNLGDINWLFLGIWAGMTALLCWKVQPARDAALAAVALAGGFGFEWWGTHAHLWRYFTGETPPAWILPAWPVAALAAARLALALERLGSNWRIHWPIAYWPLMLCFAAGMVWFIWPSLNLFSSKAACALIGIVIAAGKARRQDLCLFVAGVGLGFFLEYWGTTRECWTYYTGQTPPLIAVAAHGFAQVLYVRTLDALTWICRKVSGGPLRAFRK